MNDLIRRQDAEIALIFTKKTKNIKCEDMRIILDALRSVPAVQTTLYGYSIDHLAMIARVLQKEDLPPERVAEALNDIGKIVEVVKKEFTETLRKVAEQCTI